MPVIIGFVWDRVYQWEHQIAILQSQRKKELDISYDKRKFNFCHYRARAPANGELKSKSPLTATWVRSR